MNWSVSLLNYYFVNSVFSKVSSPIFQNFLLFLVCIWFSSDIQVADCCFLCVTEVLTEITPIYALNEHSKREITLRAITD